MEKDQARELNAKIQLDSKFRPKARRILKRMVKDFENLYAEKGAVIDMQPYSDAWEKELDKHYKAVEDEFIGKASKELQKKPDREQLLLILTAFIIMRRLRKVSSRQEINDTSSHQIDASIEKATALLVESGVDLTNAAIAATAGQILRGKIDGRAAAIATTETQFIAETVKKIEADAITNNKNSYLDAAIEERPELVSSAYVTDEPTPYEKEWQSTLSPTTRAEHAAAHGQRVKADGYFYVWGEYLKYPGDTSMGASAKNVVNCYCRVRYNNK